ncbi:helix-turn-helix transcriptional regulator [Microbacterium sp. Marseille-Q6965]|uniref:helix-turn-helix transcriptional regulator n=1 Tax=Microbacterium sp. Marseille-Q6965 TaxID=2965072 RepID=UPI0037CBA8A5
MSHMSAEENVRSKVRELRGERGLSQQALGDAVGVSRQTINAIETGRYDPSLTLAVHLARFFGAPVEEVFDVDG